ncbi:MAG: metallophosphoesterase [Deltaproteobacteria bacterium]|nr:metallophosphoesterase [Deltaproteobacteria bacterium]
MDVQSEPAAVELPQEVCPAYTLEQELPARVVVIGDLNAQHNLLVRFLQGMKLMKRSGAWCGGKTVLVQMGDIPNRGGTSRAAMDLMIRLRMEAREAGGEIYWLLGNHEVMTALGHEAYVSADEYLEFATHPEVDQFYLDRTRFMYELLGPPDRPQYVEPMGGRVRAWEEANAPGKAAFRAALGPDGVYGAYIRRLPVAFKLGTLLFVHGGLSPQWADLGLEGLEEEAQQCWASTDRFYQALDPNGLFRDPLGPLWHRAYCVANAKVVREDLQAALRQMGARQMLVGHTRTDTLVGGRPSVPILRHRGRLVMTDVGLGEPGEGGSALVVERGKIEVWSPGGERSVLTSVKKR